MFDLLLMLESFSILKFDSSSSFIYDYFNIFNKLNADIERLLIMMILYNKHINID